MMLAFLSLGFSSVVQAEEILKGSNGEELTPGSEEGLMEEEKMENTISDELSGVSEEPPIPTPENSIMLPDEPIEEEKPEVSSPVADVYDSQSDPSFKEKLPFITIIVVMVLAAMALLVFAFKKFKERK